MGFLYLIYIHRRSRAVITAVPCISSCDYRMLSARVCLHFSDQPVPCYTTSRRIGRVYFLRYALTVFVCTSLNPSHFFFPLEYSVYYQNFISHFHITEQSFLLQLSPLSSSISSIPRFHSIRRLNCHVEEVEICCWG